MLQDTNQTLGLQYCPSIQTNNKLEAYGIKDYLLKIFFVRLTANSFKFSNFLDFYSVNLVRFLRVQLVVSTLC